MLTKDSKTVLYVMYREYLSRRKNNVSRSRAKSFGSASMIRESLFRDWSLEDLEDSLRELGRNGFLNNFYADDTVCECLFTDSAISIMENQKKDILLSVANFVSKFIP